MTERQKFIRSLREGAPKFKPKNRNFKLASKNKYKNPKIKSEER